MNKHLLTLLSVILLFTFSGKLFAQTTTTFNYLGAVQTYTVPSGVTSLYVDVIGAQGGGKPCHSTYQSYGGCGGRVQATITVNPGDILDIYVGQKPVPGVFPTGPGGWGWAGGGGTDEYWTSSWPGAGGGGASAIIDITTGDTLIVSGGGGGGGGDICVGGIGDKGGLGGGLIGGTGTSYECTATGGGRGGSTTGSAGGAGGTCVSGTGITGALGIGANCTTSSEFGSGGGGGGYYGGGSGAYGAGGGGGSSYANPLLTSGVIHTQGYNGVGLGCPTAIADSGVGQVIITVTCNAGAINGITHFCYGSADTTTLSDTTAGGIWSSSATGVASISATGLVTMISPGTTVISYSVAGCAATTTFSVNPIPANITGTTTVCVGSVVSLSNGVTGGTWSNDPSGNATTSGTSGAVTGVNAGPATITYTLPAGCYTTVPVTVYSTPGIITGPTAVCVHDSIALIDTPAGRTWSSSAATIATVNASTGMVTGISGGSVNITYSNPTGCYATYPVTINPIPNPIGGLTTVCAGDSINLTDATAGGTWSTPATNATVSGTGGVLGISEGIASITYSTALGCDTTINITVNSSPAPITGPDSVCVNSTITLTEDSTVGTWSTTSTTISVNRLGIVTGMSAGTGIVTYTMPAGCNTTFTITVNALPGLITGAATVCEGSSTILTDGGSGTWTSSDTLVAKIDSITGTVNGILPGTTTITYTQATGCVATMVETVNPQPDPITGPIVVCVESTITLTDDSTGGSWSIGTGGGTATVSATSGIVGGISPGEVIVTYTLPGGCNSTFPVEVHGLPGPITGPLAVCLYDSVALADDSAGGEWTASNGYATIDTFDGVVTGNIAGLDTITYTSPYGCMVSYTIAVAPLPSVIGGPDTVCASGGIITLTDTARVGTWVVTGITGTATITAGGVLTGGNAGTVLVTFTSGTSCSITDTVTVNPLPAVIGGASAVCAGGATISLTDATTPAGTWSLTDGTGTATVNATSGVVTGETAGTITVTYTIYTGCYVTAPITVDPLPSPITGPDSVCVHAVDVLTETTGSGTWISTNTGIATVDGTGNVTGVASGMDSIIFEITATSCETIFTITVNPIPSPIYGPDSVCASGGFTTVFDSTIGGTWSLTDGTGTATVTASGGLLTGGSAGTVTTTYQLTVTGCYVTESFTVNPLPAPISGPDTVCVNGTASLTDASGGTWSITNSTLATITGGGVVSGLVSGLDTVINTLVTGCKTSMQITINPLPDSITGPSSVCVDNSTTVNDLSAGGTWSITDGTGTATITPTTGIITGTGAGDVTVNYTIITGCTATYAFTVNPIPDPIAGVAAVCQFDSVTFTDASPGGTWTLSNITTGTINSGGTFLGNNVGTDTVTYTLGTGCSVYTVVTVQGLPSPITGPDSVCVGSQTNVFDFTRGGTWSTTNNTIDVISAFGQVTGNAAGVDSIVYTSSIGCSVYMSFTVNPLPDAIGGPDTVCQNSQVTATDGISGGTWTSSNTRVATINPTTGLITGINRGVVTITYTLPTSCYVIESFTVNPLPTPIFGPTQVCVGSTVNLFDGEPVTWSITPTTIATIDPVTGIVTGVAAGTATVTAINIHGCDATLTMTVNPVPGAVIVPLGDTLLCPGGFVTLTANTGAGLTYQWDDGGTNITGATASSLYANTTGLYGVTVTNTFACSSYAQMNVDVIPVSSTITYAGSDTICYGTVVVLNDVSVAGLTYQWFRNGLPIAGGTAASYSALLGGSYYVVANNAAGCSFTSDTVTLTILPTPAGAITVDGSMTFCVGDSVTFIGDTGSTINYQWSVNGVPIPGATNRVFVADSSGTYSLFDINSDGCTAVSLGLVVTANPLPADSITASGTPVICTGGGVTLYAPAGAGYTYQWYLNGFAIAGFTSYSMNATSGGLYTVKVITAAGCSATTDSGYKVTQLGALAVSPITPTTFCWGSSAYLTIGIPGSTGLAGIDYQWQRDGINITGATSNTYEAFLAGDYNVLISIPSVACLTGSDTVSLTVNPLPDPIITFSGGMLMTQTYYTTYQWYENTYIIPGATTYQVRPSTDGDYAVYVTDTNGCQSFSDTYILTSTLSVASVNDPANDINVYPNPTHSLVYVESKEKLNGVLTTIEGKKVAEARNVSVIDLGAYADGIYLLTLFDENGVVVKTVKLVKTAN